MPAATKKMGSAPAPSHCSVYVLYVLYSLFSYSNTENSAWTVRVPFIVPLHGVWNTDPDISYHYHGSRMCFSQMLSYMLLFALWWWWRWAEKQRKEIWKFTSVAPEYTWKTSVVNSRFLKTNSRITSSTSNWITDIYFNYF